MDEGVIKKSYKFYITVFIIVLLVITTFLSIGYSALNQDIQVSGDVKFDKYEVWAENLSYDKSTTNINCPDAQCMLDCISDATLCPTN